MKKRGSAYPARLPMLAPLKDTSIVNALIARICRHVTALPVPSLPFFTL